jgi:hypothetical protein
VKENLKLQGFQENCNDDLLLLEKWNNLENWHLDKGQHKSSELIFKTRNLTLFLLN